MKKWIWVIFCFWGIVRGVDILPLTEIRSGMKGIGFSVFAGWEALPFEVDIIDIVQGTTPEDTLILGRLSGQNLEKSGVVAGMSGSPVYVDGKLIGAVAYAWSFAKEALCGITPAQAMIKEEKKKTNVPPAVSSPEKKRRSFFFFPLSLWCENEEVLGFLSNRLSLPLQLFPLTGKGGVKKDAPREIRAGDAVAVHLVDGDVRIQALGTITAVLSNKVWMFGHPLFQAGPLEAPFSRAYIYTVMPAYSVSFKLGEAGEEIGSIVYDGAFTVEGIIGKKADMISVKTTIVETTKTNLYHYRVIRSPLYQNYFLLSGLFALLRASFGMQERHILEVSTKANVVYKAKSHSISYQSFLFWERDVTTLSQLIGEIWDFLNNIGTWDSESVRLESLEFLVKKSVAPRIGFVEQIWVDKSTYHIGETIKLSLQMRDNLSQVYRRTLQIPIPSYLGQGKYSLIVGDAQGIFRYIEKETKLRSDILNYEEMMHYYKKKQQFTSQPSQLWYGFLIPSSSLRTTKGEMQGFPKRYLEWRETGPNVGLESKRFTFLPLKEELPFLLFYDVSVLSVSIQTTNTRSSP